MHKQFVRCTLGLLILCAIGAGVLAQQPNAAFTKAEILRRLKPVPGQRSEQADLADEIALRGIAFPVDEKTLDEFRKAGARNFVIDAIRRVDPNAPRQEAAPKAVEPAANPDRPRLRPRDEAEPIPPVPPATPELTEEERRAARAAALAKLPLLEKARVHAAEYLEELPNFIVTQFVTRSVKLPDQKDWKDEDKLEVEMSYHDKRGELVKLVKLNGKPTTLSYDKLGGATSTGEFGTLLGALFATQSQAEFKEIRTETLRGHPTTVFTFKVKKAFSNNQITDKTSGRTVTAGYEGTVWIETATARVLRVEQSAVDIQRGFPITLAESAIEYDWVTIAETKYLLPISAEVLLGQDSQRFYSRNSIELRNYRMFDTDMKIVP
jgi:hypothetical protein